jgi:predicted ribosome quality control (RQC) complex YloA/Tae2 family protein
VRRELEEAENALRSGLPVPGPARKRTRNAAEAKTGAPNKTLPKNVRAFVSGDGLLLLCGRDAAGNLALLRLARPDDLWLHAEGGPGAHVLVRSGRSEIPERSLHEAAQLAVAKSIWRGSARARVICARARFVRPVKGAPPGTVRVEKTECVRDIAPDADCVARIARV